MTEIPQIEITGGKDDRTPHSPGWISCVDSNGEPVKPIIRCDCGEIIGLQLHHVHADGIVTASFYHSNDASDASGCGWHVWLKLIGYDKGDFPPEGGR